MLSETTTQAALSSVNLGLMLCPSATWKAFDFSRLLTGRLTKICFAITCSFVDMRRAGFPPSGSTTGSAPLYRHPQQMFSGVAERPSRRVARPRRTGHRPAYATTGAESVRTGASFRRRRAPVLMRTRDHIGMHRLDLLLVQQAGEARHALLHQRALEHDVIELGMCGPIHETQVLHA